MVQEHKQYGLCRHLFELITLYYVSTKWSIDDIFTVSLGHTIGPSLQEIISQNGIFYGMYLTAVREFDGIVWPSNLDIASIF